MKLDEAKVKSDLEGYKSKAQEYANDPEKTEKLFSEAVKKADGLKGPLEKVWEDLQLMFGIVMDWIKGEYRDVPIGSIIAIITAIIYFVSPIDIIPDFIPVAGYVDDVFVVGLVINQVRADLHKYKVWKENR
jgi:uncharacterized membrane protein YkvA (DUF1232 family)